MLLYTDHTERKKTPSTVHGVANCFSGGYHGSTCKGVMYGNSAEITDLCPEVEETDVCITPHVMHAIRNGIQHSDVLSGKTDSFS